MNRLDDETLDLLRSDLDDREDRIRMIARQTMAELPQADVSNHVVATYFVVARHSGPAQVGREIAYHMTSGVRTAPPGSLLAECTGELVDAVSLDLAGHIGVVRVAFPLKMLLDEKGALYSTDLLHVAAGAGVFALTENADIKLVDLTMSDAELQRFPGPAYGARGIRNMTKLPPGELAFGTILKPCTGITPQEEASIVAQAASNPMFVFVKEDENFLPGVSFAPLKERLRWAMDALDKAVDRRGGRGLIYAPHVTSPPQQLADYVNRAIDAGANGVMFSEYYVGGAVRMVRDMTAGLPAPPAIYGHNGGITSRTRHIWREVLDRLARLDGIDFRQTAPLAIGRGLLRPSGAEWRACEDVLSQPLAGHPPVMMARAGGLDQGNIIPNLIDVQGGAGCENYLFLAGSAINGINNAKGENDLALGATAMQQAVQLFRDNVFAETSNSHVADVKAYADAHGLHALSAALAQR